MRRDASTTDARDDGRPRRRTPATTDAREDDAHEDDARGRPTSMAPPPTIARHSPERSR
jgi:hypothetical protein